MGISEDKEFLFIVAKIEKECIKNQCSQIINKYMENNKISDKNSFRERLKNINEPFRQQPIAEELSNTDRKESVEERIHE